MLTRPRRLHQIAIRSGAIGLRGRCGKDGGALAKRPAAKLVPRSCLPGFGALPLTYTFRFPQAPYKKTALEGVDLGRRINSLLNPPVPALELELSHQHAWRKHGLLQGTRCQGAL